MYGSQNYTNHPTGRESSMDALSRTIEGLEARIEGLMAQAGRSPQREIGRGFVQPDRYAGTNDPLAAIRARQDQLGSRSGKSGGQDRLSPNHAATQDPFADRGQDLGRRPLHDDGSATVGRDGLRDLADSISAMRRELKAEIQENLSREFTAIRQEVRDLTAESRQMGLPDDMTAEMSRISQRIERLAESGGNVDALRLELDSMRNMLDGVAREDSVRALENRWQSVEDRVAGIDINGVRDDLVKLAHRIDDIRDAVATMPASAVSDELENRIGRISHAIEDLARRSEIPSGQLEEHFEAISGRLDEVTRAVVSLQDRQTLPFDPETFSRLESRINAIAKKMGGMETFNLAADVGGRLDAVTDRLDQLANDEAVGRLDERLAQLQIMLESDAGSTPDSGAMPPDLAQNIADLSGKLDRAGNSDIGEQLAHRLDDLAQRIDMLQSAPSQTGAVPDNVIGRLEALIDRVEDTASRTPDPLPGMQSLETRLAEISARLDQPQATGGEVVLPDFSSLEERLNDISAKLDRAGTTTGAENEDALLNLEAQIQNLSRQIATAPGTDGIDRIDSRLGEISEHLSGNDEFIIEAARQAAESVLAAHSNQNSDAVGMGGQPGNLEIITALADDLKALEALSRQSEDRNGRALESVQETLLKIAEKMEQLVTPQPVQSAAAPQMPRAETEELDKFPESIFASEDNSFNDTAAQDTRSPAEAAAMAAAYASVDMDIETPGKKSKTGKAAKKSLLSGLTSKIMSRSNSDETPAEPRFTESETPPLAPELGLDDSTANMPLEPGSGAPDINRILQRVRESQAGSNARNSNAGDQENGEFLASARRAAMAAAAEVDTIGKSSEAGSGKPGLIDTLKLRRKPILMAVGAILLVVMTMPLVKGFLEPDNAAQVAEAPVVTNQQPVQTTSPDDTPPQIGAESAEVEGNTPELPQVRVVEVPKSDDVTVSEAEMTEVVAATDVEAPAAQPTEIAAPEETAPVEAVETALMADLASLPDGLLSPELRNAAEDLNPLAFYEIGARFTEGRGTAVNLDKATVWYSRAANLGHAPSQYRLANFHEKGSGVTRDLDAAKKWYQLAAEQGNASAMHNLAVLYATAGEAPDFDSAATWFTKAAELGVRDSQVNLAILYARGDGVERDLEQSYKWFAIAANEGDKDAAGKRDEVYNALRPEQADTARAKVANWKAEPLNQQANSVEVPANWGGVETRTASVDMSKAVRNIQAILNNNGFNAGKPDGVMGAKTVAAIKAFQTAEGMEPTGKVTDDLVRRLLERNE